MADMNSTLKAECKALWDKLPGKSKWDNRRMAIAVLRTVLIELGCKEQLADEMQEDRFETVKAIESCFTAPVNFRRQQMVKAGIAPKMAENEEEEVGQTSC